MIIGTDVLIWHLRGNSQAKQAVESSIPFSLSVVTYREMLQGMRNREDMRLLQRQLRNWDIRVLQIDETISARALSYVQEFVLSHSVMLADALIAAETVQYGEPLLRANDKHYRFIPAVSCRKSSPAKKKHMIGSVTQPCA